MVRKWGRWGGGGGGGGGGVETLPQTPLSLLYTEI